MHTTSVILLTVTVIYAVLTAISLPIIVLVIHKMNAEYQKLKKKGEEPSIVLYLVHLAFYIVTFATIFGLMFMAFSKYNPSWNMIQEIIIRFMSISLHICSILW